MEQKQTRTREHRRAQGHSVAPRTSLTLLLWFGLEAPAAQKRGLAS
jgi:hypothetical protein